jgi:hypothetical protein
MREWQIWYQLVPRYASFRMTPPRRPQVDLSAYVAELPPTDQLKLRVPAPIDRRLDSLVEVLVREIRELRDIDRSDLVAALIQTAEADPRWLADRIEAYREARVYQTLGLTKQHGRHSLSPRRVGRRPRYHDR